MLEWQDCLHERDKGWKVDVRAFADIVCFGEWEREWKCVSVCRGRWRDKRENSGSVCQCERERKAKTETEREQSVVRVQVRERGEVLCSQRCPWSICLRLISAFSLERNVFIDAKFASKLKPARNDADAWRQVKLQLFEDCLRRDSNPSAD